MINTLLSNAVRTYHHQSFLVPDQSIASLPDHELYNLFLQWESAIRDIPHFIRACYDAVCVGACLKHKLQFNLFILRTNLSSKSLMRDYITHKFSPWCYNFIPVSLIAIGRIQIHSTDSTAQKLRIFFHFLASSKVSSVKDTISTFESE